MGSALPKQAGKCHKALKGEDWGRWSFVMCLWRDGANHKNRAEEEAGPAPCAESSSFVPRQRRECRGREEACVPSVC